MKALRFERPGPGTTTGNEFGCALRDTIAGADTDEQAAEHDHVGRDPELRAPPAALARALGLIHDFPFAADTRPGPAGRRRLALRRARSAAGTRSRPGRLPSAATPRALPVARRGRDRAAFRRGALPRPAHSRPATTDRASPRRRSTTTASRRSCIPRRRSRRTRHRAVTISCDLRPMPASISAGTTSK